MLLAGYWRRRRPGRSTSSGEPASICCAPRSCSRSAAAATPRCCCSRLRGRLEPLDVRLCRNTYLDAWGAALFAGHLASAGGGLLDVSRAAAAAPDPPDRALPCDLLLDGLALIFTDGMRAGGARCCGARSTRSRAASVSVEEVLRWGWLAARAAIWLWDYDSGLEIPERAVQLARDSGALEVARRGGQRVRSGRCLGRRLRARRPCWSAEVEAVKEATGSRIGPYAAISLAGLRGREAEASALIESVLSGRRRQPARGRPCSTRTGRTPSLMNGLGRYEEALAAAAEAIEATPRAVHRRVGAGRADRGGHEDRERRAVPGGRSRASASRRRPSDADWALGVRAPVARAAERGRRRRALVPRGDRPPRAHAAAARPRARASALRGVAAPRGPAQVDAREQLRSAHELFESIGMEAFAERARGELLATGEKVRKRTAETRDELTAAGAADRAARPRRTVEPGDRRAALPQPAHRRMAPAQGVRKARGPLSARAADGCPSNELHRVALSRSLPGPQTRELHRGLHGRDARRAEQA